MHFYQFGANSVAPIYCDIHDFSLIFEQLRQPGAYYYAPLFFAKHKMGYMVVYYDHPETYGFHFRNWMKSAANGLEFLLMKNSMDYLVRCQNLSEMRDSTTHLYNAEGFYKQMQVKAAASSDRNVLLVLIKLEAMSMRSESVSSEIGTNAVTVTAAVLKALADTNAVPARLDTTSFALALTGTYDSDDALLFLDLVESTLRITMGQSDCDMAAALLDATVCALDFSAVQTAAAALNPRIQGRQLANSKKRTLPHYAELERVREAARNHSGTEQEQELGQTCKRLLMSKGHFQNLYKRYFDVGYLHDRITGKCSYAKYLLALTRLSTGTIAAHCGYEDEKHFMKQFRQYAQITTSAYRSRVQKFHENEFSPPDVTL